MRTLFFAILLALHLPCAALANSPANWRPEQVENLSHWIDRAADSAIILPKDAGENLRAAITAQSQGDLDPVANEAALELLRAYHGLCCGPVRPRNWHIGPTPNDDELRRLLADALIEDRLDLFLRSMQPRHPYYRQLSLAYAREQDGAKKRVLALNLARWRWMPRTPGQRYLLVNAASQEVTLWQAGEPIQRWRTIVGKPSSPTPIFSAEVSGVVFNPWWEIPPSIAAEGIAAMVRRNPALARQRGYVYRSGRYRQRPGDNNALGRMKLVMPNPYSVYLHDTSNRELFGSDERTLSHGCVRVNQALQFASALLEPGGWTQARTDETVAAGKTVTISLPEPLPVYIAYFTAEPGPSGTVSYLHDVYGRDGDAALPEDVLTRECALPPSC